MEIRVSLPKPDNITGKDIKRFLRQMELSVHHLQKSWEEIEEDARKNPADYEENWQDNYYLIYGFPQLKLYSREADNEGFVKVHQDEEGEQMQDIEIEICSL